MKRLHTFSWDIHDLKQLPGPQRPFRKQEGQPSVMKRTSSMAIQSMIYAIKWTAR